MKELAVAGTQVASAPRVPREVFLSHTSRCSVKFSSARGGGRGRGGARSAVRRGVRRVSEWAKALGREVCSPASWRCVPRRVSAKAKARRLAALSTLGGLGRYWAAQWHLARAVGKRFRGCRAKRLYVHFDLINTLGVAVPTGHYWPLGDAILGLNKSGLGVHPPEPRVVALPPRYRGL